MVNAVKRGKKFLKEVVLQVPGVAGEKPAEGHLPDLHGGTSCTRGRYTTTLEKGFKDAVSLTYKKPKAFLI